MSSPVPESSDQALPADRHLPSIAHPDPAHLGTHPSLLHSGLSIGRFYAMHALGAIFPITAGLLFYGWRGALVLAGVIGTTLAGIALWRGIGSRGAQLRYVHGLWLGILLALMLPVHLASERPLFELAPLWPMVPAAGLALATFTWALGGAGSGRIHPVLLTYLLLLVLFGAELTPHWSLQRQHILTGDALDAPTDRPFPFRDAWAMAPTIPGHAALYWRQPASQQLLSLTSVSGAHAEGYVSGSEAYLDQPSLTLDELIRDRMPPLEDLIIGGHPGPLGASSAIAIIVGGLFLLYRGLIDYRIPLLMLLVMYAALLVLPIPIGAQDTAADGARQWHWLAIGQAHTGWALAITFVNYQMLAGPALFTAFFLATAPSIRPMARSARAIYAILIGILAAVFQLYISVSFGPYLALFLASLLTPTYDKLFRPKPLV